MRKLFVFTLLILCAAFALPQSLKTFHLKFEKEGNRKAWIAADNSNEPASEEIDASKTDTEIAAPDNVNAKAVYVRDLKTNKVAQLTLIDAIKKGTWAPKPEDFAKTYELQFSVANAKGPVSGGVIKIQSDIPDNAERTVLIDESMIGKGSAYLLMGKTVAVTYTAKIDGKEVTTDPQTADLRAGQVPNVTIVAPADAPVLQPKVPPGAPMPANPGQGEQVATTGNNSSTPAAPAGNPIQTFINMVIALAIIGGLGYAAWWYTQNNQGKVEDLVKKAGLDPKNKQADPTGAMPVVPEKAAPLQKIVLDPNAAPATTPTTPPNTPKIPSLVNTDGTKFDLPEGESTVGRENAALLITGNSSISRAHAQITRSGNTVTVTDLGSTNGTFINGTKVEAPTVLNPGDMVLFGTAAYRYEG